MDPIAYNPLLLSQPIATSSPTISLRATKCGPNSSLENLNFPRFQRHIFHDESSTDDLTKKKWKSREDDILLRMPKLNKSLSSPSFESFRNSRRKPNDVLGSSVENILGRGMPEPICLTDKQKSFKNHEQSNASVSSSSGLDSPIKSDRRKRRVSIQFKKKQCQQEGKNESRGGERRESVGAGILTGKSRSRRSGKGKYEETDATTSERERTNSVSSRTSSLAAGSNGRRKFSNSSNRTYLNDEKIPWCGCWGNGCV